MKSLLSPKYISVFLILLLTGCALVSSNNNETERTYPEALDFKFASVLKLKNEIEPPDSLNADVYVNAVLKCPKDTYCFLPDGIIIADTLTEDTLTKGIHLYVENPLQFEEGEPYRLSLELSRYPGNGEKRFKLLGYSELLKNEN